MSTLSLDKWAQEEEIRLVEARKVFEARMAAMEASVSLLKERIKELENDLAEYRKTISIGAFKGR